MAGRGFAIAPDRGTVLFASAAFATLRTFLSGTENRAIWLLRAQGCFRAETTLYAHFLQRSEEGQQIGRVRGIQRGVIGFDSRGFAGVPADGRVNRGGFVVVHQAAGLFKGVR
jgi:hypothetical protein